MTITNFISTDNLVFIARARFRSCLQEILRPHTMFAFAVCLPLLGCGDDAVARPDGGMDASGTDGGQDVVLDVSVPDAGMLAIPETYAFESTLAPGSSSVSYSGQALRQVLAHDLHGYMLDLQRAVDEDELDPSTEGQVVGALDFFFRFDSTASGALPHRVITDPPASPLTYGEVSTDKDLVSKLAGVDFPTDFAGYADASLFLAGGSAGSPEGLLVACFETLEDLATAYGESGVLREIDGDPIPLFVTDDGLDLAEFVRSFLVVALAYHQGVADYLDDATPDKGINSDNNVLEDGETYTTLEHAWDEAFGYFGASREYGAFTDEELGALGGRDGWSAAVHDTDESGAIDLDREYNFGLSRELGARDFGSARATDFTGDVMDAFLEGRAIIALYSGVWNSATRDLLVSPRDRARSAWERGLAATVIHHLNRVLRSMRAAGTGGYDVSEHVREFAAMKALALGLQFNPQSPMTSEGFAEIHELMGDRPVFDTLDDYQAALLQIRVQLQVTYEFDSSNLGDPNGQDGW